MGVADSVHIHRNGFLMMKGLHCNTECGLFCCFIQELHVPCCFSCNGTWQIIGAKQNLSNLDLML